MITIIEDISVLKCLKKLTNAVCFVVFTTRGYGASQGYPPNPNPLNVYYLLDQIAFEKTWPRSTPRQAEISLQEQQNLTNKSCREMTVLIACVASQLFANDSSRNLSFWTEQVIEKIIRIHPGTILSDAKQIADIRAELNLAIKKGDLEGTIRYNIEQTKKQTPQSAVAKESIITLLLEDRIQARLKIVPSTMEYKPEWSNHSGRQPGEFLHFFTCRAADGQEIVIKIRDLGNAYGRRNVFLPPELALRMRAVEQAVTAAEDLVTPLRVSYPFLFIGAKADDYSLVFCCGIDDPQLSVTPTDLLCIEITYLMQGDTVANLLKQCGTNSLESLHLGTAVGKAVATFHYPPNYTDIPVIHGDLHCSNMHADPNGAIILFDPFDLSDHMSYLFDLEDIVRDRYSETNIAFVFGTLTGYAQQAQQPSLPIQLFSSLYYKLTDNPPENSHGLLAFYRLAMFIFDHSESPEHVEDQHTDCPSFIPIKQILLHGILPGYDVSESSITHSNPLKMTHQLSTKLENKFGINMSIHRFDLLERISLAANFLAQRVTPSSAPSLEEIESWDLA
ncbi:MAG: aminoglycoside phosphotransferase family protein [Holosporales bacterium]|nr:aminoglycoside phosphotransferase family protein [Holosporales bacterium]